MEQSYIKAVEKKLKLQGLTEEEIAVELKKIINPNNMPEEEKIVDEVNMPVVEETPDADIEKVMDSDQVEEEEVDTEEEVA